MNCARVQQLLPDYSVEILDARAHGAVDAHLATCQACRRELQVMDAVVALVERDGRREPPVGLFNGIRNQIESGQVRQEGAPWWWLAGRPARALAMGTAMAAVALGLLLPVGQSPLPPLPAVHPEGSGMGGVAASGPLLSSIRQHAQSAAEGPLADRVAWEAMAQLVSQKRAEAKAREDRE